MYKDKSKGNTRGKVKTVIPSNNTQEWYTLLAESAQSACGTEPYTE